MCANREQPNLKMRKVSEKFQELGMYSIATPSFCNVGSDSCSHEVSEGTHIYIYTHTHTLSHTHTLTHTHNNIHVLHMCMIPANSHMAYIDRLDRLGQIQNDVDHVDHEQ